MKSKHRGKLHDFKLAGQHVGIHRGVLSYDSITRETRSLRRWMFYDFNPCFHGQCDGVSVSLQMLFYQKQSNFAKKHLEF